MNPTALRSLTTNSLEKNGNELLNVHCRNNVATGKEHTVTYCTLYTIFSNLHINFSFEARLRDIGNKNLFVNQNKIINDVLKLSPYL